MNNTAMNTIVQTSLCDPAFRYSFGYKPRSGIVGLYDDSILHFGQHHCIAFYSSCTMLHSHQQCIKVAVSGRAHQHLSLPGFFFFYIASIMCVQWYLIFPNDYWCWVSFYMLIGLRLVTLSETNSSVSFPGLIKMVIHLLGTEKKGVAVGMWP